MRRLLFLLFLFSVSDTLHARLPDLIPYRKGNLWGYCDSTKKIRVEPRWKHVSLFRGNAANIYDDRGWGLIDNRGTVIVEPQYYWMDEEVVNGTRKVMQAKSGPVGAINERGEVVVPLEYEWLWWSGPYLQGMKNNKTGFFDAQGKTVVPFVYNGEGERPQSLGDSGAFVLRKEKNWGVSDTSGKVIIPFQYEWITASMCGTFAAYSDGRRKVTYFNVHGTVVQENDRCPAWQMVYPQPTRLSAQEGYKQTWVDSAGRTAPHRFMQTQEFRYGMAAYRADDSLYGYVNEKYEVIYPPVFVNAYRFDASGLAKVWINDPLCATCRDLGGFVDTHGTRYWE